MKSELDVCPIREYPFICSSAANMKEFYDFAQFFEIIDILTDETDGAFLVPIMNPQNAEELRDENVYVIFADKEMSNLEAFSKRPYSSYSALVKEFKGKLRCYLPRDFDWDGHIGNFSYAAYA